MRTERDMEIVDWIGRLGAAGAQHVMRRFSLGRAWADRLLNQLVAEGLLERRGVAYAQAGVYVASRQGLRLCGLSRLEVHFVNAAGSLHDREVASVAVELHSALHGWRVMSKRELRIEAAEEGEIIGSARMGRDGAHLPDLLIISPEGKVATVEVEMAAKEPLRLERVSRNLVQARNIDAVHYLVSSAPARAVETAASAVGAADRIAVLPLAAIAGLVAPEAQYGRAAPGILTRWRAT